MRRVAASAGDHSKALRGATAVPLAHLRDWLPDLQPQATPYHGGCMVEPFTMQQDLPLCRKVQCTSRAGLPAPLALQEECVVPLRDAGAFVDEDEVVVAEPVLRRSEAVQGLVGYTLGGPREEVGVARDVTLTLALRETSTVAVPSARCSSLPRRLRRRSSPAEDCVQGTQKEEACECLHLAQSPRTE